MAQTPASSNPIVQDQVREFQEALLGEERRSEIVHEEECGRDRIATEFAALPDEAVGCRIRFHMPDNSHCEKVFAKTAPASWLFVHVRHFVYPRRFGLVTGFPQQEMEESEAEIQTICGQSQVLVHVLFEE
jgi:hypothetical protein